MADVDYTLKYNLFIIQDLNGKVHFTMFTDDSRYISISGVNEGEKNALNISGCVDDVIALCKAMNMRWGIFAEHKNVRFPEVKP
jgi:hypothetical protein